MEVAEGAAPAPAQQESPVEQEAAEPEVPPAEETEDEKQAKMTQAVAALLAQKTALLEVTRAAKPRCVPLHALCSVLGECLVLGDIRYRAWLPCVGMEGGGEGGGGESC